MRDLTVLLTGVGADGAYGVIRALRENGERDLRLVGVDIHADLASRGLVDRFAVVPRRDHPDFWPSLARLIDEEGIEVVLPIPTLDQEMFAAAAAELAAGGVRVVVSAPEPLAVANHKDRLYQALAEPLAGFLPRYRVVEDRQALLTAVSALGYPGRPVCLRKPVSIGAQGFRVLDAGADLAALWLERNPDSTVTTLELMLPIIDQARPFPRLIVQEYLPGAEYDVDALCLHGRTLTAVPRRNDKMLWGMALVCQAEEHQEIIELSRRVIAALGLSYVVNLTFKLDAQGRPRFLEVNPRVPASIYATVGAGINLPYMALKLALGEEIEISPAHWGSRMLRYWEQAIV